MTPYYIDQLEGSSFFIEGSYSHTPVDLELEDDHFPMIISSLPYTLLYNQDRIVMALFQKNGINFILVNGHLNSKEGNRDIRREEIDKVRHLVQNSQKLTEDTKAKKLIKDALDNQNIFFMGDFNVHFPGENQGFDENNFHDLWLEQHSHFDGLTWDPVHNNMNHYKSLYDNRRMRLDRVCLSDSKQIDIGELKMVANHQISKFGLFPSDHFGLSATFCKSESGFIPQKTIYKEEFAAIPQDITGYRTQEEIIQLNNITYASLGAVGLLLLITLLRHLFR